MLRALLRDELGSFLLVFSAFRFLNEDRSWFFFFPLCVWCGGQGFSVVFWRLLHMISTRLLHFHGIGGLTGKGREALGIKQGMSAGWEGEPEELSNEAEYSVSGFGDQLNCCVQDGACSYDIP